MLPTLVFCRWSTPIFKFPLGISAERLRFLCASSAILAVLGNCVRISEKDLCLSGMLEFRRSWPVCRALKLDMEGTAANMCLAKAGISLDEFMVVSTDALDCEGRGTLDLAVPCSSRGMFVDTSATVSMSLDDENDDCVGDGEDEVDDSWSSSMLFFAVRAVDLMSEECKMLCLCSSHIFLALSDILEKTWS